MSRGHHRDRRPGSRVRARQEVGGDRAVTGPLNPAPEKMLGRTRRRGSFGYDGGEGERELINHEDVGQVEEQLSR